MFTEITIAPSFTREIKKKKKEKKPWTFWSEKHNPCWLKDNFLNLEYMQNHYNSRVALFEFYWGHRPWPGPVLSSFAATYAILPSSTSNHWHCQKHYSSTLKQYGCRDGKRWQKQFVSWNNRCNSRLTALIPKHIKPIIMALNLTCLCTAWYNVSLGNICTHE